MDPENSYWTRRARAARFTRRRLLGAAGLTGVGVAGLTLVGCGDDDDNGNGGNGQTPGVSPTAKQVNRNGVYRWRQSTPMATINTFVGLEGMWGSYMKVYDHLWVTPLDTQVTEDWLAEKTEIQDPTHFTVKIKPAFFHNKAPVNGRAVTAEDVKASFEGIKAAPKLTKDAWWNEALDKVEVVDEKTVKVTLKKPDAWTFHGTKAGSTWTSNVIPKEHATEPSLMDKDIIGSGMFELVSHENGANIKVKRNENFRRKAEGWPNLAGIESVLIQEQAAAIAAFAAKQIDGSLGLANKLEKDQLSQQLGKDITIDSVLSRAIWMLITRADGQWADPKVNQAFSLALDKKEILSLLVFNEGKISGPVPPTFTNYAMSESDIATTYGKFDPAEAKKLLAATSFDTSKEYTLKFCNTLGDNWSQFTQIMQSQLQKNLGIKTKIVGEDYSTWLLKSLFSQNYEITTFPTLQYDEPSSWCSFYSYNVGGAPNYTGMKNKTLNDGFDAQAADYDDKSRAQKVKNLQMEAWKQGNPFIPTVVGTNYTAFWNYVKDRPPESKGQWSGQQGTTWLDKS